MSEYAKGGYIDPNDDVLRMAFAPLNRDCPFPTPPDLIRAKCRAVLDALNEKQDTP